MKKLFSIFVASVLTVSSVFCQKPFIYDKKIPATQTCTLSHFSDIFIKKFNGKSVNWRSSNIVIPAGNHEFEVNYSSYIGNNQYQAKAGIIVRYNFVAGRNYTIRTEANRVNNTVNVFITDDAEVEAEKQRLVESERAEFFSMLPNETTEPTQYEGIWKERGSPSGFPYISFKGNTFEYFKTPQYNAGNRIRLFIIEGDILKLFDVKKLENGEWDVREGGRIFNNYSEHRFVFNEEGFFSLKTIKGFDGYDGTFYKEQTQ